MLTNAHSARPVRRRVRRRARGGPERDTLWHVRAGRVILATGAHERPIAFAGNDLPGVMLAGAVATVRRALRRGSRASAPSSSRRTTRRASVAQTLTDAGAEVDVLCRRRGRLRRTGTDRRKRVQTST